MIDVVTIDFEASCLPRQGRSFPIEVGICGALGTSSWLIRPLPEWRQWDWTDEAFRLHGIDRDMLEDQGIDPAIVMSQLLRAVGGSRVIADSPIDRIWWQTLLDAAAPKRPESDSTAPLVIEHISDFFDELGATAGQIRFAQMRADELCPQRHRAGTDARWQFCLLSALTARIAADRQEAAQNPFPSWTTRDAYVQGERQPRPVKG